uniref:protein GAMETE EXPRESSED 2 n=1 Tax=Erigeron canadensis TaxID=72917 RepID=UPI001CB9413F|nr:protein GAMETE EXPRESSED 2 [Erigeron canadensis]
MISIVADDSNLRSPTLSFRFVDNKRVYTAGDTATIQIVALKGFKTDKERLSFKPNITFNRTLGDSSYVTGLTIDMPNWKITFVPIMVGRIYLEITHNRDHIMEPTLDYNCTPGVVYELGSIVSWMGEINNFVAGNKATILIYPKDAFGNNVTSINGVNLYSFMVSASNLNGTTKVNVLHLRYKGWDPLGYFSIEFELLTSGHLLVDVKNENVSLNGAPLPLTVHPEALVVGNCLPQWSVLTKFFQIFSRMEGFIHMRDKYGNLVPGMYEFDFEVVRKGTKLPLPISELHYKEVSPGIQSFSFKLLEPGDFILMICSKASRALILDMPFEYNVYIGYCDDFQSIVEGPGLNDSVAGEVSKFHVLLKDAYQYPSPLDTEKLQVQITLPSLSLRVNPQIHPRDTANDTQPTRKLDHGAFGHTGITSSPSVYLQNKSEESVKMKSSEFDIDFVPEKSGTYEILIFCGNVPLNDGIPFRKVVSPGSVDVSKSTVSVWEQFAPASTTYGNIKVKLLDSFSNPILSKADDLVLEIIKNRPKPTVCVACHYKFEDNHDGTYKGTYMVPDPDDLYSMFVKYGVNRITLEPSIDVYAVNANKWPFTRNDTYNVWEDQSIAFDALKNDTVPTATIVEVRKPRHGSLLQYGALFRYTPYKGFYGNDGFKYVIQNESYYDAGYVKIYVLPNPPQFISFPKQLQATEKLPSPKFDGYTSIELKYSDPLENISVKLSADHGTVFLSPLSMLLWDPIGNELSVNKMEGKPEYLNLTGQYEVINLALKSLKYIGEDDFSGTDSIRLSAISLYGTRDLEIPIFVEAINEPPFIDVPKFIILDNMTEDKGFLIFDKDRDNFNFSVGDPDYLHFSGNKTDFRVMFSVEVSSGFFSAKLPSELTSTTELKVNNSKQWQPLQSFVEISRFFTVKAKGIRFQGTINHCNGLLKQLLYYGDGHDADLRIRINDLGWYGCFQDCTDKISVPLISEATLNLITSTPVSSVAAHSLGSVIVVESIVFTMLAMILMFFTCKCVIVLLREKKDRQLQSQNVPLIEPQSSLEQMSNTTSSDNVTQVTANFPSPVTQTGQPSNLPES